MSQQLHLFSPDLSANVDSANVDSVNVDSVNVDEDSAADSLVEQTRQLFQHQGSNAELIERIVAATKALNALCKS